MIEKSVSIVIPVYNEEEIIDKVLIDIKNFCDLSIRDYEIVCVNDCSKDNSLEVLKNINFITLVSHKVNKGYGAALKSGINQSKNEIILIMDSDGQHKVEDIPNILKPLDEDYDMSVGSRKITNTKKSRVLGKILIHKLANYLIKYDIPDINSGFRCFYKSEAQKYFHLCSDRFSFTTSITLAYLQENKDICYTPIEVNSRITGQSHVNYKAGLRTILKIIQIIMVFNPLRFLLPIALIFLMISGVSLVNDIIDGNLTDTTVLFSVTTVLIFIFSLLSDQLSTLRRELWVK